MTPLDMFTVEEWTEAGEMHLRCEAHSEAAAGLVDSILADLSFPPSRPTTIVRRRMALGALLADLLKLARDGRIGSHGTARQDFPMTALGFGVDVFASIKDALVAAGLLRFQPGRQRKGEGFEPLDGSGPAPTVFTRGWVARFGLTPAALARVEAAGIWLDAWDDHWRRRKATIQRTEASPVPSAALIGLRSAHERVGRSVKRGKEMPVDMSHATVRAMVLELEEHNAFLKDVGVDGVDFIGLRRLFNDGDKPGFDWQWGGRFYSVRTKGMDRPYEVMSGEERRKLVRLGGKPVGEADMNASQLRLLYALQNAEIPEGLEDDPYNLAGLDRDPLKRVIAQALGKGQPLSRSWGKDAVKDYAKANPGRSLTADYDFKLYQKAALEAHPVLLGLGQQGVQSALELQYIESEIIGMAMSGLRLRGIASLPVHDSLIVANDNLEAASEALLDAFRVQVEEELGCQTPHRARVSFKYG